MDAFKLSMALLGTSVGLFAVGFLMGFGPVTLQRALPDFVGPVTAAAGIGTFVFGFMAVLTYCLRERRGHGPRNR